MKHYVCIINDTPAYTVAANAMPEAQEGFFVELPPELAGETVTGMVYAGGAVTLDPAILLTRAKTARISQIKADAARQIDALAWRIERAKEREMLGLAGETVNYVLLEREAIRRASTRTESEINAAMDVSSVNAVPFSVTDADRTVPGRISRVEFLNRFTDDEMQAFITAAKTTPALEAYLMRLQSAEGVVLTDPVTMAGVQALEMMGIIAAGRAAAILAVS